MTRIFLLFRPGNKVNNLNLSNKDTKVIKVKDNRI